MLRKFIVLMFLLLSCLSAAMAEPQRSSSDSQARFFDLSSLLGINRYRPPYYGGSGYPGVGSYPGYGGYPGVGGIGGIGGGYPGVGGYPGYGTNFIGNGYGGYGGNGGLQSYLGYNNRNYQGGGNLGYGYYSSDAFEDRNIQPQSVPSGYRGYN